MKAIWKRPKSDVKPEEYEAFWQALTTAQAAVGRQDWREAEDLTKQALDQWRQVDTLHVHYTNAYLVRHASSNARSPYWLYLEGNLWQGDPFHQVSTLSYVSSHEPPSPVSFSDNLGHTYDFSGAWYVGHLDPRASEIYLDYDQFGRH